MSDPFLKITCSAAENINVAFYQNAVPIIRELTLENELGRDLTDISVRLSSEPAFLTPGVWRIERLSDKATNHLRSLDLKLDSAFLAGLTASRRAELHVVVEAEGVAVADSKIEVTLLPPNHWGGSGSAPELLAAFVRPTDPAVDVILREASDKLAQAGKDSAVDGYAKRKKARAWEIAGAIWAAIVGHSIAYVLPPKSFEREGQQVRGPSDILSRKVGTCLDLSLLYASCLEQAGLNSLLVLTEGHAFCGVWLIEEEFSTPVVDDPQMLRKRVQLEEMILVETTLLTGAHPARFAQAVEQGAKQIADEAESALEVAIDVRRSRRAKIKPLDLGDGASSELVPKTADVSAQEIDEAPKFAEDMVRADPAQEKILDRLESWKRSLLDLTMRNRLLNFKEGKATIAIECPEPAKLEDMLAGGQRFKLLGRATVLGSDDARDATLFTERQNEDGRKLYVAEAMSRGELHAGLPEADLDGRLTDLFRAARLAFEEGGANILYLCLGFLKWTQTDGGAPYRAPLILIPVSLERKSVRSGFRLALHDDEVRLNPTLIQMLAQDFDLTMPEFTGELPRDASGIDVAEIWRIVRTHIKTIKGWEVTEHVVLATLSFTKYLMWKDLVDRTDSLKRNPVVRHLIDTPTHGYEGAGQEFIDPARLDEEVDPSELFTPLSADSSQVAAVVAAQRGKDFVLFGPPGTGKSQTITNMISSCLAHGKSVLFVSQKTAALEVVRRRLQSVGLGNYCLEVHSTKAQKSVVIEQLAKAWRERDPATEENWAAASSDLKGKRAELNKLVSALHRRRENGLTAYEAFGRVVADQGRLHDVGFSWPPGTLHTPEGLTSMRAVCGDIRTAMNAVGDPSTHPLRGIEQTKWTPAWSHELERIIGRLQSALVNLKAATDAVGTSIGLPLSSWDFAELPRFVKLIALLLQPEARSGASLLGDDANERFRAMRNLSDLVTRANLTRAELTSPYDLKATRLDLAQMQKDWAEASAANFLVKGAKKNKIRLLLKPYCADDVPAEIGRDIVVLQDLADIENAIAQLQPAFAGMEHLWRGIDTDVAQFEPLITWATQARDAVRSFSEAIGFGDDLKPHIIDLLVNYSFLFEAKGDVQQNFEALRQGWASAKAALTDLGTSIGLDQPLGLIDLRTGWDEELIQRTNRWKTNLIKAPQWARWKAATIAGNDAGLGPLVAAVEAGAVPGELILPTFEYSYARWCAEVIVNGDEILSSFLAEQHEAAIEAFTAADSRVSELSKQIVRARIGGSIPTMTTFGKDPEWGTLAREVTKKVQHIPLRQLFSRIPSVLTKLTPCVMMSPLSIAQYLPADAKPFDIVIFDEASQIPVWDAIGAIARGNQVVIVGDPEQLPPTTVGQRSADGDDDDDGGVIKSQQSILDECLASNLPSRQLSWHYRSRHESLIAFSNAKYYRGELVTFPSPVTRDTAVRYLHVEGGVYERGKGKVNRKEAEAVVAEVVRRLRAAADSIGVVTFNSEQQRLIENLFDQARRSDPSLDRHFDRNQTSEPVLVKNIENVQGDERDVIVFSVAVGPDQTGRVTAQISSLNGEGGHRRLNVAVTRARRELIVFATLRPEQIDLGRTSAKGVVDFKHFLEFAQNGARAIAEAFAATGGDTDSPFEEAVKQALEAKGWTVHPQIGVSFFRVDLGVVHPDFPGRYLAGVECDGATYHSSATARDRDRLREMVLTDLGWRIRRIWSTEWWMDAASALNKIHDRLVADLEAERTSASAVSEPETPPVEASVETEVESADTNLQPANEPTEISEIRTAANDAAPVDVKVYARKADVGDPASAYVVADPASVATPDRLRFYDLDYRPTLRQMVDHVVEQEAPIYFDVLVDRISRAHGFQRAKDMIRGIIKAALASRYPITSEDDREIIWPLGADPTVLPPYRSSDHREHGDVPLPELAALANQLRASGLDDEEVVRAMQEHFRLGRLALSTRTRFEAAAKRQQ
jgi:very-short-patch-repair endonuclease